MTLDHVFQLGALAVAAATLLLNHSDLRHRRELRETTARLHALEMPPPQPHARTPPHVRTPPPAAPPLPSAPPLPKAPPLALPTPPPPGVGPPWSLTRRVVAHLIDFYLPLAPVSIVSSYALDDLGEPLPGYDATWGAVQILFWGLVATQVVASGLTGRTVGRLLMGGLLVDAARGEPIGVWRVLGHSLPLMLLGSLPALGAYRSRERRGFHDDWTNARFVSTRAPAPSHIGSQILAPSR
jgi:RDD family